MHAASELQARREQFISTHLFDSKAPPEMNEWWEQFLSLWRREPEQFEGWEETLRDRGLTFSGGYRCRRCERYLYAWKRMETELIPLEDVLLVGKGGLYVPAPLEWFYVVVLVFACCAVMGLIAKVYLSVLDGSLTWTLFHLGLVVINIFITPTSPIFMYWDWRWGRVYRCFDCDAPPWVLDRIALALIRFRQACERRLIGE